MVVSSIAFDGISYTPTGTTSFVLNVVDPCLSAIITSSTVTGATLIVYAALST